MTRFLFVIFLLCSIHSFGQTAVKMGVGTETVTHEMDNRDASSGRYWRGYPLQMKAGTTVVVRVWSKTDKLQLMLNNANNESIFTVYTTEYKGYQGGYMVTYKYTVPNDQSVNLYVIAVDAEKKSTYTLSVYEFQENQYNFQSNYSFCDRFNFIFNLCLTGYVSLEQEDMDGLIVYKTNSKLYDKSEVSITSLFSSFCETMMRTKNKEEAIQLCEKTYIKISECIDPTMWTTRDLTNTSSNILEYLKYYSFDIKSGLGADGFNFSLYVDKIGENYQVKFTYIS